MDKLLYTVSVPCRSTYTVEGTPAEIFDEKHEGRLGEFLGKVTGVGFREKVRDELRDILADNVVTQEEIDRIRAMLKESRK